MATSLVPFEVPASVLAELMGMFPEQSNKDLTEGVQPSFAVVTFRGKVWRVRHKGEDRIIKAPSGDPVSSIVAVLVKASPAISKLYYAKNYTEGDDAPPICFSLDGIVPDNGSVEKQSPTCAACPHNVWGSRVTEVSSKGKACADNRRVAIVPYPDIKNETFGGPMLLRIPPTSLQELARLGDALKQSGLPYQAVVVKISFDYELSYPKLIFNAIRPLTKDEAITVIEHMNSDATLRMLMEPVVGDETNPTPAEAVAKPVEPQVDAPVPNPLPKQDAPPAAPPAAPKAKPAPKEVVQPELQMGNGPDKEEEKKPSPAQVAKAPADVVSEDLNSMIMTVLGDA